MGGICSTGKRFSSPIPLHKDDTIHILLCTECKQPYALRRHLCPKCTAYYVNDQKIREKSKSNSRRNGISKSNPEQPIHAHPAHPETPRIYNMD